MDLSVCLVIAIMIGPILSARGAREDWSLKRNQQQHYKVKREMLAAARPVRRGAPGSGARYNGDPRKKVLDDRTKDPEDQEDKEDLTISVGPPPRPKPQRTDQSQSNAAAIVKSVLTQLTQEFIFKQVDENFVFGQYVGNSMRALTKDQRLAMQREVLELILRYSGQKRVEPEKPAYAFEANSTGVKEDESWDFSKLDQIVG